MNPDAPTPIYVYPCPECDFPCRVPGTHQHANGEWIDHATVKTYLKMKEWDTLFGNTLARLDSFVDRVRGKRITYARLTA